MNHFWPKSLNDRIDLLPKHLKTTLFQSRVDILSIIDKTYGLSWSFDLDNGVLYPSLSLGVFDKEDGWLFHTLCEVPNEISFRLARSLSVTPRMAKVLYQQAHKDLKAITAYLEGLEQSLSKPLTLPNGNINPNILSGIIRFDTKDYRDWSDAISESSILPVNADHS